MSKRIIYRIEFYNYWHSGSGLSGTTYADNIVNKTDRNLPYIPGRTLKGLLRDAAENIHKLNSNLVTEDFIEHIFGKRIEEKSNNRATFEDEGTVFFTNAMLSEKLSDRISNNTPNLSENLYAIISSTKIDESGQAANGSLRQLEVTIPLTLYASIEHFPEEYLPELEHCFGWIKEMGQNRNRGLGKCKFSLYKN
jgi:CRISPR/Cas system CSM-associated protein Csm3 (group 7 of RAMP superfamily)